MNTMNLSEVTYHAFDKDFKTLSIYSYKDFRFVTVVSLNRPEKRNAINSQMWKEIGHAFKLIGSAGDGCRCVLLVGNGKAFCAGIDISDPNFGLLEASDAGVKADTARRYLSFRYKILDMQRA